MAIYHGYLVLFSTFVLNFVALGVFGSSGLFLGPLAKSFPDSGNGILAFYCTIQLVTAMASSFLGGIAQEKLPDQNGIRLLFYGGGISISLGLMLSSVSVTLIGVLSSAILIGFGVGIGGFMSGSICVLWFEEKRGMMLLLAMSGQGAGGTFFAWATGVLLERFGKDDDPWRRAMRCIGILCLFLSMVSAHSMRLPYPGEVETHEKSAEKEMLLDKGDSNGRTSRRSTVNADFIQHAKGSRRSSINATSIRKSIVCSDLHQRWSVVEMAAVAGAPTLPRLSPIDTLDEPHDYPGDGYTLQEIALSSTNSWLCGFTFVSCFTLLNLQVFLASYVSDIGMSPSAGGYALGLIGIGTLLSNLALGPVIDKFGAIKLYTFSIFIISTLYFAWPHCKSVMSLNALAFMYGFLTTTSSSLPLIILADAYGEIASEHILVLSGMLNLVKFPGYMLGPYFAGIIIEKSNGFYGPVALSCGIITGITTLMLWRIPSPEEQLCQLSSSAQYKTGGMVLQ